MPDQIRSVAVSEPPKYRSFRASPETLNEDTRTVDAVLATDAPVPMFDWDSGERIDEVLLMSGAQLPSDGRLPLCNCHRTSSISDLLGSCTKVRASGSEMPTTLEISKDEDGDKALAKIRGGHLRDMSVGYRVTERVRLAKGEKFAIDGRVFEGPKVIATKWAPHEGSLCPIGADYYSKIRSEMFGSNGAARAGKNEGGTTMPDTTTTTVNTPVAPPPAPGLTIEEVAQREQKAREEGQRIEADRQSEIRGMCSVPGCEDMVDELTKPGITVEEAGKRIFARLRKARPPVGTPVARVEVTADEADKFRAAASDALAIRAIRGFTPDKPASGAEHMARIGLHSLMSACIRRSGGDPSFMTPQDMVRRLLAREFVAQGTADFTNILANVANKAALVGFKGAEQTFRPWCRIGQLKDFKSARRVGISDAPALVQNNELAEVQYGAFGDRGETIALLTYAIRTAISRQALINDDLSEFDTIFRAYAYRWATQINSMPYGILIANAALADTGTLFNTTAVSTAGGHANQASSASTIDDTNLAIAEALMMEQVGQKGMKLNLRPKFLMCGSAKKHAAEVILAAAFNSAGASNTYYNVLKPIVDTNITGNKWYLAADPNAADTVEVAFLDGNENLTVSQKDCSDVLGVEFMVYGDAACAATGFRGLVYNAGA